MKAIHYTSFITLASLVFNTDQLAAQNAHLVRLDTAALNTMHVGRGVPTIDGGSIFQVLEQEGSSLWKCDATGNVEWQNHYASTIPDQDGVIAPTANGDVLLAYATAMQSISDNTTIPALDVWRIAQDGSVAWRKNITLDTLFNGWSYFAHQVEVVENVQSEIFLLSYADMNWISLVSITKLTSSGDVLWSRRIGDPSVQMNFPFGSPSSGMAYLAPDALGGCRLVSPTADDNESVHVINITTDGSLAWGRFFDYLGSVQSCTMAAPAVAANGNTVFFTSTNTMNANGGLHSARISESGDLLSVEQYEPPVYCADLINDQGTLMRVDDQRVVSMTETGDFLTGVSFTALPASEDSTYHFFFNHLSVKNGRACFAGTFTATPTGPGLPWVSPAISSFDLAGSACGLAHFTPEVSYTPLPNSIFACDPMASIASDTLAITVSDGELSYEPRTILAATSLCVYTAVPNLAAQEETFSVDRTLLNAGDGLTASSSMPIHIMLRDAKGALVWHSPRAEQRIHVPTFMLAPGLYLLTAQDRDGRPVGIRKVMVQR